MLYKILVEKKELLSILLEAVDAKDAIKQVTQVIVKNIPNRERVIEINNIPVTVSPLNISIVGAPEAIQKKDEELVIETKGN